MLLSEVVAQSLAVGASSSRTTKVALLAELLVRLQPAEIPVVVSWLSGELPQGRIGIGWAVLASVPNSPTPVSPLGVLEVDAALTRIADLAGPGSSTARARLIGELMAAATPAEQHFLTRLLLGDLRQGALAGVMELALSKAGGAPLELVRQARLLSGSLPLVAQAALTRGAAGLRAIGLQVGRPLAPMLASSARQVGAAMPTGTGGSWSVERKVDGIRIQVHRCGGRVQVFTRSLEEITDRVPEVVGLVAGMPLTSAVLDGEAIALDQTGRPRPFQVTASRVATRRAAADLVDKVPLSVQLFDLLHLDGADLIDEPLATRRAALAAIAPPGTLIESVQTTDPDRAEAFFAEQLGLGHEGVVIKELHSPYLAGRRGGGWVKVKPRHTLDLVVIAVEWGSGRRTGMLSNIHLAARDGHGGFVMLGKTFKGMTDEMLRWQTERFLALETGRQDQVVRVRPEQVVEVAFDGLQTSPRYPAGLALRFARVLRYRTDKTAEQADDIDTVKAIAHAVGL